VSCMMFSVAFRGLLSHSRACFGCWFAIVAGCSVSGPGYYQPSKSPTMKRSRAAFIRKESHTAADLDDIDVDTAPTAKLAMLIRKRVRHARIRTVWSQCCTFL